METAQIKHPEKLRMARDRIVTIPGMEQWYVTEGRAAEGFH
jgi:hypothetical protein